MVNIWYVLAPVLAFAASAAGLFLLYWTIRLAVRHGIADARRQHDHQPEVGPTWDTARF